MEDRARELSEEAIIRIGGLARSVSDPALG